MINVYERAKELYPDPWNKAMLKRLVRNGSLAEEQYEEITGEKYEIEQADLDSMRFLSTQGGVRW